MLHTPRWPRSHRDAPNGSSCTVLLTSERCRQPCSSIGLQALHDRRVRLSRIYTGNVPTLVALKGRGPNTSCIDVLGFAFYRRRRCLPSSGVLQADNTRTPTRRLPSVCMTSSRQQTAAPRVRWPGWCGGREPRRPPPPLLYLVSDPARRRWGSLAWTRSEASSSACDTPNV